MSWHSFWHGVKHDFSKAGHAIEGVGKKVLNGAEGVVGGVIGGVMGGITGGLMGMNDADIAQLEQLMTGGMEMGMMTQIFDSFQNTMSKPGNNN
ncbi:hypothetical protein [Trinickia sp. Y13]|uniref:hypothetical protein n=1 Tax=Trinickia sp. Y13 TaxID=2917807 RepID=UPI002405C04E|nr:hypothetical protein [Trinickia sp. Y13]MDG0025470.1 hypothetical protein [Trinickia sp. Y13]